jgi:hypothetical protein
LKPTAYDIYTKTSLERRVHIEVSKPTGVWWNRL